ncbi:MAG TPA: CBASS cGAMP-activated phospholipase [Verrucomicrobiota bacterium]|nr:CBASS cGAMP-activated phospholipase [Verrucomicrobiota bacterium]HPL35757.1 CBASS cGAMP-activated phospholipase [Verrucomicrobiota bacterium]HQH53231.1 CBASS cGAMP-activated phospholipase [Candidatus Hydrogenedentota bacterium]HRV39037.1 CBASS cGAMP-activated phospholipase [Candidatus Paceibacterota bacterium]
MSPSVFKVLSIDGGGIKGVYTAAMLRELEHALARIEGHSRLGEYFDLICGTSTGALIALGLAAGRTCDEIAETYLVKGPQIFKDQNRLYQAVLTVRQFLLSSRYDNQALRAAVEDLLGDRKFSESQNYLLIPVTNLGNYTPRVFKTRHSKDYYDGNARMADIALASAAAPTFFPILPAPDIKNGLYADGGMVANNPTLLGVFEAFRVFVGPASKRNEFAELAVLSLGNYGSPQGFRKGWFSHSVKLDRSIWGWAMPQANNLPLLNVLMDGQTALAERAVTIFKEFTPAFRHYCRIDAKTCKSHSTPDSELLSFNLADARPHQLKSLEGYGMQDGQSAATDPVIRAFFETVRKKITLHN